MDYLPADIRALADAARDRDPMAIAIVADRLAESGDALLIRKFLHALLGVSEICWPDVPLRDVLSTRFVSVRVWKALHRLSLRLTPPPNPLLVRHLTACSASDLARIRGVGPATLAEIRSLLGSLGLQLKGDWPPHFALPLAPAVP